MRRLIFSSAFVLTVLALAPEAYAAEFVQVDRIMWHVRGTIAPGDEKTFQALTERQGYVRGTISLVLKSNGGDVETALKIGRIMRREDVSVHVPDTGYCRSACVFLLAGGVARFAFGGEVAIHRPYFAALDPALSSQQVDAKYKKLVSAIYDYLKEMNIPTALADAMLAIPPNEMHVLSEAEMERYMLNQDDPGYDERETAQEAAKYRISSAEFRRRTLVAEKKCESITETYAFPSPRNVCKVSSILSLPLAEVRRRLSIWGKTKIPKGIEPSSCYTAIVVDGRTGCVDFFGDIPDVR